MTNFSPDPIPSFPARAGFTLLVLLILTVSCRIPSAQDDPDLVTSLHFTPSAFDSFRRNTELKYSLKTASTVSIYIVRQDSALGESLVRTLVEKLAETKGAHSITWLGDSDQHLFVPTGTYFAMVRIGGRHFETVVEVFHF